MASCIVCSARHGIPFSEYAWSQSPSRFGGSSERRGRAFVVKDRCRGRSAVVEDWDSVESREEDVFHRVIGDRSVHSVQSLRPRRAVTERLLSAVRFPCTSDSLCWEWFCRR